MSFYIEENESDYESDYESDVDNIYNDNLYKEPTICNENNDNKNKSYFGVSFDDVIKNANFDWFLRRLVCLEEEIIDVASVPSFNNKKIKSDEFFTYKNCSQCAKQNIDTTFCCLVRNESYYFCNSDCWSSWINKTKVTSNDNMFVNNE